MLKDRGDSQAAVYGPEMTIAYGPYDMKTLGKNFQKTRMKKLRKLPRKSQKMMVPWKRKTQRIRFSFSKLPILFELHARLSTIILHLLILSC